MPSNVSKSRRAKAFDEGRRAARQPSAENPYDNATLAGLWDRGRAMEAAGQVTAPVPPLKHGETRARRVPQMPAGSRPLAKMRPPSTSGAPRPGRPRPRPPRA